MNSHPAHEKTDRVAFSRGRWRCSAGTDQTPRSILSWLKFKLCRLSHALPQSRKPTTPLELAWGRMSKREKEKKMVKRLSIQDQFDPVVPGQSLAMNGPSTESSRRYVGPCARGQACKGFWRNCPGPEVPVDYLARSALWVCLSRIRNNQLWV